MKSSKLLLPLIALLCIAALGAAMYLQIVEEMLPCPLCIIQRYLFVAIAFFCIVFSYPQSSTTTGARFGLLFSLCGAGTAGWHLWVQAHPGTSCGVDPLETTLNTIPTANLFPTLFKADGLCAMPYPFLGLSIPQWSLICFAVIAIMLTRRAFKRN